MTTRRPRVARRDEAGFTIIESMAAAAILVIAVILTITPIAAAMRDIERSKRVTVAEQLAQGRIEEVRSLDYGEVGNPGRTPDGVLARTGTTVVGGDVYQIDTDVRYAGSATGLDVVPQGGDGVQGAPDPGIDYKVVTVVVTPRSGGAKPVRMETIIAPATRAAVAEAALVVVTLDRYEPYGRSSAPDPVLRLTGPRTYVGREAGNPQVFSGVVPGGYVVDLFRDEGWRIHPESSAATRVDARRAATANVLLRIYRPVALQVDVLDPAGARVGDAVVAVTDTSDGRTRTNVAGAFTFSDLVPDPYRVDVAAPGFLPGSVTVDVPGPGGAAVTRATVRLVPAELVPTTFLVDYAGWPTYVTAGARVTVTHPDLGTWHGVTGPDGRVTIELPRDTSELQVTAATDWGHAPAARDVTTEGGPLEVDLHLGKPPDTVRLALVGGPPGAAGHYEYRVRDAAGWGEWVVLDANAFGKATFLVRRDEVRRVRIRAVCPGGRELAHLEYRIRGRDLLWRVHGRCP